MKERTKYLVEEYFNRLDDEVRYYFNMHNLDEVNYELQDVIKNESECYRITIYMLGSNNHYKSIRTYRKNKKGEWKVSK